MKNRKTKIFVDILLLLSMIIVFIPTKIIPISTHYFFGLLFAVLVLIHVFLNRKWCVTMTKALISGKPNKKAKRQYFIDLLLLILCVLIILSGFLAMGCAMGHGIEFFIYKHAHVVISRIGSLVILIHLYQHKEQIRFYLKKNTR